MTTQPRKILVTCALPYANGAIHLGHMLEHIQADIWVRFQRMRCNNIHNRAEEIVLHEMIYS